MKHYKTIIGAVLLIIGYTPSIWSQISQSPPPLKFKVNRFEIVGNHALPEKKVLAILNPFLGQHSGLEGLQAAADALESEVVKSGNSFLRVVLPPQTLQGGVVKLQVVQFRLGKTLVKENKYFSKTNVLNSLPSLKVNQTPNTRHLMRELSVANAHPSKKVELLFKESDKPNQIDAHLKVIDKSPGYFFTVLQNTGTEESGDYRLTGGYQYSNLFGRDHGLTFTYTTAPDDTDAVSQFGLNYRMPFYRDGSSLSFLYSDSNVDSGVVQDFFEVSGSGTVIGTRYDKTFLSIGSFKHSVAVSYNDKLFENDVSFDNEPIGSDVRSNPLTMAYSGNITKTNFGLYFNLAYLKNFPSGSDSADEDYAAIRAGYETVPGDPASAQGRAESEWSLLRYGLSYYHRFGGGWLFRTSLKGQQTGQPLIPGEQFGLGGIDSIRGYEERAILADYGWSANFELWSKPFTKLKITPLLFYDLGNKGIEEPLPGETDDLDMASVGLGMRMYWKDILSVRLDYASVREPVGEVEDGDSKLHLSVFYRF